MDKKRININGTWYVKEEHHTHNITEFRGLVVETDTSCFEFTVNIRENVGMYGANIKYTDKRCRPWDVHYWDNEDFLRSVNEKTVEGITNLTSEDNQALVQLINKAKELKFI